MNNKLELTRFEVFTTETMKNAIFRDVTPYGFSKNLRFGRIQRLYHQGENAAS
jgi:hypothetical protein